MSGRKPRVRPGVTYACDHVGCDRVFSRRDHLARHKHNHNANTRRTCPECGRAFVRQDVLDAHLVRHETRAALLSHPCDSQFTERSPSPTLQPVQSAKTPQSAAPPATPYTLDPDWTKIWSGESWGASGWDSGPKGEINEWDAFDQFDVESSFAGIEWPATTALPAEQAGSSSGRAELVTSSVRDKLLEFLPTVPELASSPYFRLSALNRALETYWAIYNPQIPIVHRPTFNSNQSISLTAAMVAVGLALLSSKHDHFEAHTTSLAICRSLRSLILLHELQAFPVPLESFQAVCILGHAGQMILDGDQHRLSAAFSAFELSLGRGFDLFSHRFFHAELAKMRELHSPEARWRAWVRLESYKRLAYLILMRDTQLCCLFGTLPARALSVFLIRLGLPSSSASWQATTSFAWSSLPADFDLTLPQAIHTALLPSEASGPAVPGPFAQLAYLHGLMAVGWDFKWRGTLRSSKAELAAATWRDALGEAVARCRAAVTIASDMNMSERLERWAVIDLATATELDLRIDFMTLLAFTGTTSIGGLVINAESLTSSTHAVGKWARSSIEGRKSASLAASYLLDRLGGCWESDGVDHGKMGIYAVWAIFCATVNIWAYVGLQDLCAAASQLGPNAQTPTSNISALLEGLANLVQDAATLQPAQLGLLLTAVSSVIKDSQWGLSRQIVTVLSRMQQSTLTHN